MNIKEQQQGCKKPTVVFRGRQRRMALLEASGCRKMVCESWCHHRTKRATTQGNSSSA